MSIVVEPAWKEASESGGRPVLHWLIKQTSGAELGHIAAREALLDDANTPPAYHGFNRTNRPELKRIADSIWLGHLEYGPPPGFVQPPTGSFEASFDISGQSQRILQSLSTINTYAAPGKTAPNFQGAINVTREGVQGADIIVPQFTYQRTWYVAASTVTMDWIRDRARLVGTVSNSTIFGWVEGQMLMTGFAGNARPQEDDWAITMRWGVRENLTGLAVGPITDIEMNGWDYLWIHHIDEEDATANMMVRRPISAYVERVYRRLNHASMLPPEPA